MNRESRPPFFLSATERLPKPGSMTTLRNNLDIMSPASRVTAESSSCSSRIIPPFRRNGGTELHSRDHELVRPCHRGSMQAKMVSRPQHHALNTSLPYQGRRGQDSILSPRSATFSNHHNVSCPVKAVHHASSSQSHRAVPKLHYLKETTRNEQHSMRVKPSTLAQDRMQNGDGWRRTASSDVGIRPPSAYDGVHNNRYNHYGDQSFRARHRTNYGHPRSDAGMNDFENRGPSMNSSHFSHVNHAMGQSLRERQNSNYQNNYRQDRYMNSRSRDDVYDHNQSDSRQTNSIFVADFSDNEDVHPDNSISCIQNQVDTLVRSHDWDREMSVNPRNRDNIRHNHLQMPRMGLQPSRHSLQIQDIGESLPGGMDNFRDNGAPDVDLNYVKEEPLSDDDVRTLDSPPNLSQNGASPPRPHSYDVGQRSRNNYVNSAVDAVYDETPLNNRSASSVENDDHAIEEATVVEKWTIDYSSGKPAIVGFPKGRDKHKQWRSSAIKRRLSRDTLLVASGKTYRLEGPLDAVSSKGLGLSDEVITAFKNGFPEDWRSVLEEGFRSESSDSEEEEYFQSYVEEEEEEGEEEGEEKGEELGVEEDLAQNEEEDALEIRPEEIPETQLTWRSDLDKLKKKKKLQKSSSRRKSSTEKESKSRNNNKGKKNQTISKTQKSESKSKTHKTSKSQTKKEPINKRTKEKTENKLSLEKSSDSENSKEMKEVENKKEKTSREKTNKKEAQKDTKKKKEPVVMETPKQVQKKIPLWKTAQKKGVAEDSEKPLSIERLPRTSSGRRVKPVLAWWAGQRVFCRGDVVEIVCDGSKEALLKENVSILNFEVTPKGKAFFSESKNLKKPQKRSVTTKTTSKKEKNSMKNASALENSELTETLDTTAEDVGQNVDAKLNDNGAKSLLKDKEKPKTSITEASKPVEHIPEDAVDSSVSESFIDHKSPEKITRRTRNSSPEKKNLRSEASGDNKMGKRLGTTRRGAQTERPRITVVAEIHPRPKSLESPRRPNKEESVISPTRMRSPQKVSREARQKYRERKEQQEKQPSADGSENNVNKSLTLRLTRSRHSDKAMDSEVVRGTPRKTRKRMIIESSQDEDEADLQPTKKKKVSQDKKRLRSTRSHYDEEEYQFSS